MLHEVNVAKKARLALLAGASAAVPGAEAASAVVAKNVEGS